MCPRKLSDADKSDILNLYRNPEETTSTLALRYGVSNSTISRILKSNLIESEYEELIQQKRLNRTPGSGSSPTIQAMESSLELEEEAAPAIQLLKPPDVEVDIQSSVSTSTDGRRRRKRTSTSLASDADERVIQTELPLDIPRLERPRKRKKELEEPDELLAEIEQAEHSSLEELLDDDLLDLDEGDDDLDEDLDDDWEDDVGDDHNQEFLKTSFTERGINVQVLPLSEASLPRTCYLVVDRAAELVARPLREFSDLGQIPVDEIQERTLPIFDNHKVARRFSNRSQRVIKVPDSRMLQKACYHLQAKGITRLLIDGQVYSLLPTQPQN
jgi:transposase-like protein